MVSAYRTPDESAGAFKAYVVGPEVVPAVSQVGWDWMRVTDSGATVVRTGDGVLGGIVFNDPVASLVATIYDNTAASGDIIGAITLPLVLLQSQFSLMYNLAVTNGITINLSAGADITVLYL